MMDPNQVSTSAITPVQQFERIQIVDVQRGFALFGILFVNMTIFSRPIQSILFPVDPAMTWFDRAVEWMKRFKYGPAEWMWCLFTYLKLQPMNKHKAAE